MEFKIRQMNAPSAPWGGSLEVRSRLARIALLAGSRSMKDFQIARIAPLMFLPTGKAQCVYVPKGTMWIMACHSIPLGKCSAYNARLVLTAQSKEV